MLDNSSLYSSYDNKLFAVIMGKNDQVFIEWVTKDKWNGVKQYVKRKDIKPYEESLHCGQEVKLKWASRWYTVQMCEDWSPKKRKGKKILYNLTFCNTTIVNP